MPPSLSVLVVCPCVFPLPFYRKRVCASSSSSSSLLALLRPVLFSAQQHGITERASLLLATDGRHPPPFPLFIPYWSFFPPSMTAKKRRSSTVFCNHHNRLMSPLSHTHTHNHRDYIHPLPKTASKQLVSDLLLHIHTYTFSVCHNLRKGKERKRLFLPFHLPPACIFFPDKK